MKQAAIDDLDGSIWAKSAEFNITPEDVEKVLTNYNDNTDFASCGLNLAGQKYFFLSGNEDVLHGKGGVHMMKTKQAVLVGVYDDPML